MELLRDDTIALLNCATKAIRDYSMTKKQRAFLSSVVEWVNENAFITEDQEKAVRKTLIKVHHYNIEE